MVQRNSVNLWKSQISFTLVLCNSAQKHCLAMPGYLYNLPGVVAGNTSSRAGDNLQDGDLRGWAESMGAASAISEGFFFLLLQASGSSALLLALPLWGAEQSGQHWLMNGAQQQEVFHPGLFIVAPGFTWKNSFTHKTSLMLSLIQCMVTVP